MLFTGLERDREAVRGNRVWEADVRRITRTLKAALAAPKPTSGVAAPGAPCAPAWWRRTRTSGKYAARH